MNKIIDKEYVKGDYVQVMTGFGMCKNVLVASPDEIIFLSVNGEVVINKYLDHEMRYSFPKSDISSHIDKEYNCRLYNMIFKTNTSYIMHCYDYNSNYYSNNLFLKHGDDVLWSDVPFDFESCNFLDGGLYTEKKLEDLILSYNRSIHIIDFKGNIVYSSTHEDGKVKKLESKKINYPLVGILSNSDSFEAFLIGKRFNLYYIEKIEMPDTYAQTILSALEDPNETTHLKHPSI